MYLSFYQIKEEPFRLTPDPRFLHLAEPHQQVLDTLIQGIARRKGFQLITGPVGTGKTTLLHETLEVLTRAFAESRLLTGFLVNPTLNRDEFLEAVLDEFEIACPSTSKPRRLQVLREAFLDAQRLRGTSLLIIDEAHLLTLELLEEIRLLSNADTYQEKLLQVILCGQPELLTLIDRPEARALRQRITSRCRLRSLSLAETRAYIAERFHVAGLRGPSPFTDTALEQIYAVTQGVPRLINLLCDGCLFLGAGRKQTSISPDIVHEVAATLDLLRGSVTPVTTAEHGPESSAKDRSFKSAVDLLIDAMRQGHTPARSGS